MWLRKSYKCLTWLWIHKTLISPIVFWDDIDWCVSRVLVTLNWLLWYLVTMRQAAPCINKIRMPIYRTLVNFVICEIFAHFGYVRLEQLMQMNLFAFDRITFSLLSEEGALLTWVGHRFFSVSVDSSMTLNVVVKFGLYATGHLLSFTRYLCPFQLLWWFRIIWT